MENQLRIATRVSPLASAQTEIVAQEINKQYPNCQIDLVKIITTADKDLKTSLVSLGGKNTFIKQLEQALIENKADIAVHSLKDMAHTLEDEFEIVAVLKRASPNDVLISNKTVNLDNLPDDFIVGTGSLRRIAQLKKINSKIKFKDCRGNINTRITKMQLGQFDALVLAMAGFERLNLVKKNNVLSIPLEISLPAPCQGIIAIECRKSNQKIIDLVKKINHKNTYFQAEAERAVLRKLGANCKSAVGAYAQIKQDKIYLEAFVANTKGDEVIYAEEFANLEDASKLGSIVGDSLLQKGAAKYI